MRGDAVEAVWPIVARRGSRDKTRDPGSSPGMAARVARRLAGLILSALLLPACRDADGPEAGRAPSRSSTDLRAVLGGRQEVPPVASSGRGALEVQVAAARTSIAFTLTLERLAGATSARLHAGLPGTNGPLLFTLASASFSSPHSGVLTATDFSPAPGLPTFAHAVEAVLEGRTYVNVETASHPGGELRGHLGPIPLRVLLDGTRVVPSVQTGGLGLARIEVDGVQRRLEVTLTTSGLSGVPTEAHVHAGAGGRVGPIFLTLSTTPFAGPLTVVLTSAHLVRQPAFDVDSFDDAIHALLSGDAYVDVHTAVHPDGEIRGQVTP